MITNLSLQDNDLIMLNRWTQLELPNLFKMSLPIQRPYEFDDDIHFSVSFEMSLDVYVHERKMLTYLDLLAGIGGFSGIIFIVFDAIQALWNFNNLENFLATRLFKLKLPEDKIDRTQDVFLHSEYIPDSKYPYMRELLQRLLPAACLRCCTSLKKTRKERAMQLAREKLSNEINIIEIVKMWRYFQIAIRSLL